MRSSLRSSQAPWLRLYDFCTDNARARCYGVQRACDDLLAAAGDEDVAQITTFARDREAIALTERLRGAIGTAARVHAASNMYWPGWTEITVSHRAAVKGAATPDLLDACSLSGVDVIACGDPLNDLGLFAVAAQSIAPANAHPAVLESAAEIVGPNDEDGVVCHLLERHGAR